MKGKNLKSLKLNKKAISKFTQESNTGGTIGSIVCSGLNSKCDIRHPHILICSW
jgi:hypothetical protein